MGNKKTKGVKDPAAGKGDTGKTATNTNTGGTTAPKEIKSFKVLLIGDRYTNNLILSSYQCINGLVV
jgi:hypothetical protein